VECSKSEFASLQRVAGNCPFGCQRNCAVVRTEVRAVYCVWRSTAMKRLPDQIVPDVAASHPEHRRHYADHQRQGRGEGEEAAEHEPASYPRCGGAGDKNRGRAVGFRPRLSEEGPRVPSERVLYGLPTFRVTWVPHSGQRSGVARRS
jgi:hypothetical protein